nr:hypothetical protein [Salinivibrio kushneri]
MLHAYPPIKPKQVHLRCVPLTSYRFLQTLPLASNALASRIIFPSVGAIQVSFNLTGLPASLGKQKAAQGGRLFTLVNAWLILSQIVSYCSSVFSTFS